MPDSTHSRSTEARDVNPFTVPSELPYAFPPFAAIRHEHYRPAFDAGAAEQRAEIQAIIEDPDEPSFANTIERLELSGRTLERVLRVWSNLCASMSDERMQSLETELAPLVAEH